MAEQIVNAGTSSGHDWGLWQPPKGSSVGRSRAAKLAKYSEFIRLAQSYDLLHVHYATAAHYALIARKPFVLHIHGDDIRRDLGNHLKAPVIRRAVKAAGAVVYSTPDLKDNCEQFRTDAVWLPAPVDPVTFRMQPVRVRREGPPYRRVFFCSRWDKDKGAEAHIEAARALRTSADVEVLGIAWGDLAEDAASAGVRLQNHLTHLDFLSELASADLVVGQLKSGVLGVSELEAMALGRPLIANVTRCRDYAEMPPVVNAGLTDVTDTTMAVLRGDVTSPDGASMRRWVQRFHGVETITARVAEIYRTVYAKG
ncbi:MAG TPA: glycosyltransferase [Acidimicrobiales bacterium]|nr:glycosyltransferase [Acidimicrobiales bacterium]